MRLTWMGTASLLLESGDTVLAFDPFPGLPLKGPLAFPAPVRDAELYRRATHVLITHGHFDHMMAIPALYGASSCPIYSTETPARTLADRGIPADRLREIGPGRSLDLGAFRVRAYQGRHCRTDPPLVLETAFSRRTLAHPVRCLRLLSMLRPYPENGEILFYQVTDGASRVQIMGSLGLDRGTDYPTGADLLVLPFQGRSDLADYALPLVERLAPRAVLLDHWDDAFPPMTREIDTAPFAKLVRERLGIPCRALKRYETLTLEGITTERGSRI